jgi:hypothetical protein
MYAGAALSALLLIITLVTIGSLKAAIAARHPDYTAAQLHAAEITGAASAVIGGLVGLGAIVLIFSKRSHPVLQAASCPLSPVCRIWTTAYDLAVCTGRTSLDTSTLLQGCTFSRQFHLCSSPCGNIGP